MFKQNEGFLDRFVRVILATVLLLTGLFLYGVLHANVPGLVTAGFGAWLLVTGLSGVCPLYIPFGISTLEKEKELIAKFKSMRAICWSNGYSRIGKMRAPDSPPNEEPQKQPG